MVETGQFIKTSDGVCRVLSVDRGTGRADVEFVSGSRQGSKVVLSGKQVRDLVSHLPSESSGERSVKGGKIRPSSGLFWFTGFAVARKSKLWFFVGDPVRDTFLDEWKAIYGVSLEDGHSGVTLHSAEHDKQGVQGRVIFRANEQEVAIVDSFLRLVVLEDATGNTRVLVAKAGGGSNYWNVNSTALLWFWGREFSMCPPSVSAVDVVRKRVVATQLAIFEQGVEYGLHT